MNFGLSENDIEFLMENLVLPLKKEGAKVFIFGSRAIGHEKEFSDIDILYQEMSHLIDPSKITALLIFFEESTFPYKIDLVNDKHLAESYRKNVERQKIEL